MTAHEAWDAVIGGDTSNEELTLPGFKHDACASALLEDLGSNLQAAIGREARVAA